MTTRQVREELKKPFWSSWTLKDVAIIGALVSTLAVDHANIQRIMVDVAAIRADLTAYREKTTESITAIRMEQQRVNDALVRFNNEAMDDKRVPTHPRPGRTP